MKFIKTVCLILCAVLLICPVGNVAAAENGGDTCRGVDAEYALVDPGKLLDTSKAVVLYERGTGTLIYSYNIDELLPPSSMVKLMTALVALEHGVLTDTVTVTSTALNSVSVGAVSAGLVRGEEISLLDLLYCMMVASANDAAAVIAEYVGGSQSAFVAMMNEKAAALGCTGTVFADATGLDDTGNQMSTRDILRILDAGLDNETFRVMFEAESYTVPATNKSEERYIVTTNRMMSKENKYFDDRVTGGKTGSTSKAGRCLAITANVGDMELIGIVMGAKATYASDTVLATNGSFEEMHVLLDYAGANFECRQLFYEGQVITQYPVTNGSSNVAVTVVDEVYCVLPKEVTAAQILWDYDASAAVYAPVSEGQTITGFGVWYETEAGRVCLARTELVAMTDVGVYEAYQIPHSTIQKQEEQQHGQVLATILGILLGIVVAAFAVIVLMRVIQTALIKARIRRRRKNRRRNRNARME